MSSRRPSPPAWADGNETSKAAEAEAAAEAVAGAEAEATMVKKEVEV